MPVFKTSPRRRGVDCSHQGGWMPIAGLKVHATPRKLDVGAGDRRALPSLIELLNDAKHPVTSGDGES